MGGYVASALKSGGHEVRRIDSTLNCQTFPEAADEILAASPGLLCVNAIYMWENTGALFTFFQNLKTAGFKGHIHLFGFYPSLAWRDILGFCQAVDSIAVGECEMTVRELADHLARNDHAGEIDGLAIRCGQAVHMSGSRAPVRDPDIFEFPARPVDGMTASILASRGCYNHCSFCPVPSFYNNGPLWRGRSPENILFEMNTLVSTGIRDFYFADPNFIGPGNKGKERTLRLMSLIRPLNITFGMETRPQDMDEEIMESLVSSGLTSMLLGVESGSETLLEHLSKGTTPNSSERAIALCRSYGIEPEIGFLMFVPDSTLSDLADNRMFLQKNNLLDRLARTANLLSHSHIVLQGTGGYRRYEKEGRLTPSGFLGFEGEIAYTDHRVAWIRDVMVSACEHVLKESAAFDSPVHWQEPQSQGPAKRVNDHMVRLFGRFLKLAASADTLDDPEMVKKAVETEINLELGREEP